MASRYCYPPITSSSMPAFDHNEFLQFRFNLSNLNSKNDIKHVQFIVTYQYDNKNAVNSDMWLDNIIYIPWSAIKKDEIGYYVNIYGDNIKNSWEPSLYYKLQARFGLVDLPYKDGIFDWSQLAEWKETARVQNLLSEWSTVTLVKAIYPPELNIVNLTKIENSQIEAGIQYVPSLFNTFVGAYYNKDKDEPAYSYRFKIFHQVKIDKVLIVDSGEVQHNVRDDYYIADYIESVGNINSIDIYKPKIALEDGETYTIEYQVTTKNLYTKSVEFMFGVVDNALDPLRISIECYPDEEEGKIDIELTSMNLSEIFTGNLILKRTSSESNFTIWEDLKYLNFSEMIFNRTKIHSDFLIESGIAYQYGIQSENINQIRSALVYEIGRYYKCNLDSMFLFNEINQLKIKFDGRIDSFRLTKLESKQDTMGSKYPFVTRNGVTSYREFPISGLITYFMDEKEMFLKKTNLLVNFTETTDLTNDNIFIERKFREKALEWLNDGKYKLFKSNTEGSIIVGLMGISLTPVEELGRMIYHFSATAYELADFDLKTCNDLGIYSIGKFQETFEAKYRRIGQVNSIDLVSGDILTVIKNQQNISIGNGYRNELVNINSIWVESYSDYNDIPHGKVILMLNGKEIMVGFNRLYTLDDVDINQITLVTGNNVIVNYSCSIKIIEDPTTLLTSSYVHRVDGQIKGTFAEGEGKGGLFNDAYDTLDILDVIFKDSLEHIDRIDSSSELLFKGIFSITIDCEPGTIILFHGQEIMVGQTGIFEFSDLYLHDIKFKESTYAIISYRCRITENTYGEL